MNDEAWLLNRKDQSTLNHPKERNDLNFFPNPQSVLEFNQPLETKHDNFPKEEDTESLVSLSISNDSISTKAFEISSTVLYLIQTVSDQSEILEKMSHVTKIPESDQPICSCKKHRRVTCPFH